MDIQLRTGSVRGGTDPLLGWIIMLFGFPGGAREMPLIKRKGLGDYALETAGLHSSMQFVFAA